MDKWPLGVFASIDAGLGVKLEVAHELGVPTIQLHAPHKATRTKQQAEQFLARLKRTGHPHQRGLRRLRGRKLCRHPHGRAHRRPGAAGHPGRPAGGDEGDCRFRPAAGRRRGGPAHRLRAARRGRPALRRDRSTVARELCDHCQANGQNLHLETGQEAADTLLKFLGDVGRDNLFVNFDPANMILYGSGEPIEALRKVGRYVRSVHCKDAKWAARPGKEWGSEVPLGEGDVGMENVPPHAQGDRLHRPLDHRTGDSPGARPAERGDRPRHPVVE